MKVLAIDHNAVLRTYRRRYAALAAVLGPDAVRVLAPDHLDLPTRRQPFEPGAGAGDPPCGVVRATRTFKSHRGLLDPLRLVCALRGSRPDVVFVDAEPESWQAAEVLCLARRAVPRARVVLSTWSNIDLAAAGFPYRPAWLYRRAYRRALRAADAILCYTAESEAILRAHGCRAPARHVAWGVDTETFAPRGDDGLRAQLGLPAFAVGYCGRLAPEKGLDTLFDAVQAVGPPAGLLLVGAGPLRDALAARAAAGGIRLALPGAVAQAELPRYYACMDVLVLPSLTTRHWKEQFGRVLIEAMACGVPVVGSDSGEIPRVMGDAGLAVPEGDAAALARVLAELRAAPAERARRASAGRRRVAEQFTWERSARGMAALFEAALAGRAPA